MNQPQDDTPDAQLARLERDIAPGLLLSVLKGESRVTLNDSQ